MRVPPPSISTNGRTVSPSAPFNESRSPASIHVEPDDLPDSAQKGLPVRGRGFRPG